jgi:hypothetical protein
MFGIEIQSHFRVIKMFVLYGNTCTFIVLISEILLKVALNTITLTLEFCNINEPE